MDVQSRTLIVLAGVDVVIVGIAFVVIRNHPRLDGGGLIAVVSGLSGFVAIAFMFLDGPFLVLQLATILGVFVICLAQHRGP